MLRAEPVRCKCPDLRHSPVSTSECYQLCSVRCVCEGACEGPLRLFECIDLFCASCFAVLVCRVTIHAGMLQVLQVLLNRLLLACHRLGRGLKRSNFVGLPLLFGSELLRL